MKKTSRVFACWRHLHAVLESVEWPAHPVTGERPPVMFGDAAEVPNECLIVVGVPIDRPNQEFVTFGAPSKDEDFTLQVYVATRVPGRDREETFARLEELCDLIQTTLRDSTTGRPAGISASAVPGLIWHHVARVAPQLFPTTEGFGAYAEIDVAFRVRI